MCPTFVSDTAAPKNRFAMTSEEERGVLHDIFGSAPTMTWSQTAAFLKMTHRFRKEPNLMIPGISREPMRDSEQITFLVHPDIRDTVQFFRNELARVRKQAKLVRLYEFFTGVRTRWIFSGVAVMLLIAGLLGIWIPLLHTQYSSQHRGDHFTYVVDHNGSYEVVQKRYGSKEFSQSLILDDDARMVIFKGVAMGDPIPISGDLAMIRIDLGNDRQIETQTSLMMHLHQGDKVYVRYGVNGGFLLGHPPNSWIIKPEEAKALVDSGWFHYE
jgi:hypothetical protein